MPTHRGYTLLETLTVVALLAVLVGLLLSAVQKIRAIAARMSCQNKARQVTLGIHGYTQTHDDRLPPPPGWLYPDTPFTSPPPQRPAVLIEFWPFISGATQASVYDGVVYRCPADPSWPGHVPYTPNRYGEPVSYCVNFAILWGNNVLGALNVQATRMSLFVTDGLSQTALVRERYQWCKQTTRNMSAQFDANQSSPIFNDPFGEVPRVTGGRPVRTTAVMSPDNHLWPWKTFQAQPEANKCHPGITQGLHPSGQVQGMCDGSVRVMSPNVADWVYWGQATPNAGDQSADD